MSPLLRRGADADHGIAPRRPHAGLLRRERRALIKAREDELRELGGLLVEMYRRGGFREDLLAERCGDDRRNRGAPRGDRGAAARAAATLIALRVRRAGPARLALLPELRALPARRRPRGRRRVGGDRDRAGAEALMASEAAERRTAIAAADATCPRCGAARASARPVLPRLRAPAADRRGRGAGLATRLAATVRLVSGRLGLALAADPARRGGRRRCRDRDHDRHRTDTPVVLTATPGISRRRAGRRNRRRHRRP